MGTICPKALFISVQIYNNFSKGTNLAPFFSKKNRIACNKPASNQPSSQDSFYTQSATKKPCRI